MTWKREMLSDGILKRKARPLLRLLHRHTGALAAQELNYEHMVDRAAGRLGIDLPPLYAHRSAANWGLLYALFRIVTETHCRRILEIGAGQSTIMLDAIARKGDLEVTTLEAKADWAEIIQRRVGTKVVHSPLARRDVRGMMIDGFDPDIVQESFDLILVDGPFGTARHSRRTALDFLDNRLADEFVVIFDDAERAGERDTIEAFRAMVGRADIDWNWIHGTKDQCIFFTPAFGMLKYI